MRNCYYCGGQTRGCNECNKSVLRPDTGLIEIDVPLVNIKTIASTSISGELPKFKFIEWCKSKTISIGQDFYSVGCKYIEKCMAIQGFYAYVRADRNQLYTTLHGDEICWTFSELEQECHKHGANSPVPIICNTWAPKLINVVP